MKFLFSELLNMEHHDDGGYQYHVKEIRGNVTYVSKITMNILITADMCLDVFILFQGS